MTELTTIYAQIIEKANRHSNQNESSNVRGEAHFHYEHRNLRQLQELLRSIEERGW